MLVQVLVDTPSSWIVPYAKRLVEEISKKEHFFTASPSLSPCTGS